MSRRLRVLSRDLHNSLNRVLFVTKVPRTHPGNLWISFLVESHVLTVGGPETDRPSFPCAAEVPGVSGETLLSRRRVGRTGTVSFDGTGTVSRVVSTTEDPWRLPRGVPHRLHDCLYLFSQTQHPTRVPVHRTRPLVDKSVRIHEGRGTSVEKDEESSLRGSGFRCTVGWVRPSHSPVLRGVLHFVS